MFARKLASIIIATITLAVAQQAPQSNNMDAQVRELQRQLDLYKTQQLTLNSALAKSKKNEAEALEQVKELSTRLQALGMYEGDKDERLLQAVADGRVLNRQLTELRLIGEEGLIEFRNFVKFAEVQDPELRKKVEIALRKLENELWGGQKKEVQLDQLGTLQKSKVISIDSQSGMLVLNVGEKAECKVGMTFSITRGDRNLGEGIVAEVRKNVSGLLVVSKAHQDVIFRVGDKARVKLKR